MRNHKEIVVCALYRFVVLDDCQELQSQLMNKMKDNGVRGTLLLAHEGINGTIAGSREGIDAVIGFLKTDNRFAGIRCRETFTNQMPFQRTRVKLKKEIVTMAVQDIDPNQLKGTYVKSGEWNSLISDPDVTVIDTRNQYEIQVGSFQNAINPQIDSFREFPVFVDENLDQESHRKVAMFCTGGIRCEKSSAYLKSSGFKEVYHLEGGILQYLKDVPEEESLWEGECFVFDERVAVNHQLEKGKHDQCHACRMPITGKDKASEHYVPGISCPHCIDQLTEKRRQRFAERERQVQLAKQRGVSHFGNGAGGSKGKNGGI